MKSFLSNLIARFAEPSTYAGLSAVSLAVAGALGQNGTARYAALTSAAVGGAIAIARSEGITAVVQTLNQALPLLPLVVPVLEPLLDAVLKPSTATASARAS